MGDRQNFTEKTRTKAFVLANGCCASCGRKIRPGETWHADHITTDRHGGANTIDNCQVMCVGCHRLKTNDDVKKIAKTNRMEKVAAGFRGKQRKGRPMPGTKASGWKQKMDGTWVRRAD